MSKANVCDLRSVVDIKLNQSMIYKESRELNHDILCIASETKHLGLTLTLGAYTYKKN